MPSAPSLGPRRYWPISAYTHRVAIANSRLVALAGGEVSFRWRDYRHHDKLKLLTLAANEFVRRFLLHILPDGFHRIRHYNFLANGHRAAKLAQCRRLLAVPAPPAPSSAADYRERVIVNSPGTRSTSALPAAGEWNRLGRCPAAGSTKSRPGMTPHDQPESVDR